MLPERLQHDRRRRHRRDVDAPARAGDPGRRRASRSSTCCRFPQGGGGPATTIPRRGRSSSRSSSARGTRLRRRKLPRAVREHRARAERAERGSRSARCWIAWRPAWFPQAAHGPARRRRAPPPRGVPHARRVRRPVHHPVPPRPPAHRSAPATAAHGWEIPPAPTTRRARWRKRHYRSQELAAPGRRRRSTRACRCSSTTTSCSRSSHPDEPDPVYFANGDGDELYFIFEGGGLLRSALGDLALRRSGDYVFVPKGLPHRFIPDAGAAALAVDRVRGRRRPAQAVAQRGRPAAHGRALQPPRLPPPDLHRPARRRAARAGGQARRRLPRLPLRRTRRSTWSAGTAPSTRGPSPSSTSSRGSAWCTCPRRGTAPSPPAARSSAASSRARSTSTPRRSPAPTRTPRSTATSSSSTAAATSPRARGVGPGSISHHPAGVPHGPHPGAYEESIGARAHRRAGRHARHLSRPLRATAAARAVEDPAYHASFGETRCALPFAGFWRCRAGDRSPASGGLGCPFGAQPGRGRLRGPPLS